MKQPHVHRFVHILNFTVSFCSCPDHVLQQQVERPPPSGAFVVDLAMLLASSTQSNHQRDVPAVSSSGLGYWWWCLSHVGDIAPWLPETRVQTIKKPRAFHGKPPGVSPWRSLVDPWRNPMARLTLAPPGRETSARTTMAPGAPQPKRCIEGWGPAMWRTRGLVAPVELMLSSTR